MIRRCAELRPLGLNSAPACVACAKDFALGVGLMGAETAVVVFAEGDAVVVCGPCATLSEAVAGAGVLRCWPVPIGCPELMSWAMVTCWDWTVSASLAIVELVSVGSSERVGGAGRLRAPVSIPTMDTMSIGQEKTESVSMDCKASVASIKWPRSASNAVV